MVNGEAKAEDDVCGMVDCGRRSEFASIGGYNSDDEGGMIVVGVFVSRRDADRSCLDLVLDRSLLCESFLLWRFFEDRLISAFVDDAMNVENALGGVFGGPRRIFDDL